MHHTSSTIVSSEGINLQNHLKFSQIKDHLQRPIYPLSLVSYWPTKPSFVLALQAQFCLAHQAQFRTSHQAQFRIGPSSPISYWPNKHSFVLVRQAQFRTGPPSPNLYWPTKSSFVLASNPSLI